MTEAEFFTGLAVVFGLFISFLVWQKNQAVKDAANLKLENKELEIEKDVRSMPDDDLIKYIKDRESKS